MLKYFKKSRGRSHFDKDHVDNTAQLPNEFRERKRHSLRSTSSFCDEVFLEHLEVEEDVNSAGGVSLGAASITEEDVFRYHSRLSMSLPIIITDPNCLSYFVQFLETRDGLPLIKFYLDTENFRSAAIAQLQKELSAQHQGEDHISCIEPEKFQFIDEVGDEDEERNSVPELKSLYDLSMRKPLTDDEKSQIYAETSKQLTKCNIKKHHSNSELSLYNQSDNTSIADLDCDGVPVSSASIQDAITIYQKYLIVGATQFVSMPVSIISQISLFLCKRPDDLEVALPISANCFDAAQHYVLEQLERDYLNDFLQSSFYCNYILELIEGDGSHSIEDQLTIYDILYSEVTLFYFMEFLEQRGERDCLDFWTAAINFHKSYTNDIIMQNEALAQADAMIIYDKFFSLQSDSRLWMSHKMRCLVEEAICAGGEVVHCFDLPLLVIAKYLERKYLRDFLQSQLFENYLSDLKAKIHEQQSNDITSMDAVDFADTKCPRQSSLKRSKKLSHRKTMSDCTNQTTGELVKQISQQNTLLAMDSSSHLKNLKCTGTNLNIDSRQLTNPNLLWHRSTSKEGGLKFGRVNSLGRYERDFEAIDAISNKHNWTFNMMNGSKIKNAMRKLVNLPEDKVQEEIAWQVAEMIVKDVTNITLNNSNCAGNNTTLEQMKPK